MATQVLRGTPVQSRVRLLTVVLVTFLLAAAVTAQVKAELVPAHNGVARDQALVQSALGLERDNATLRADIASLNQQVQGLNTQLGQRSTEAAQVQAGFQAEKELAGVTAAHGPGEVVTLADGKDPHLQGETAGGWLVRYIDIQDVVNVLWAAGAEAVAVNQQRVVPSTSFFVAGNDVLMNGVHITSPYTLAAIGDRSALDSALAQNSALAELKDRTGLYQVVFSWTSERDIQLPAYNGAFVIRYAVSGR
jgi:uncharacterized protein YlxW (UPF0749 family)